MASEIATATPVASGVQHQAGDNVLQTRMHYGIPILQKSFFWDGNGEVDNSGLGLHAFHFLDDGVALGLGTNAAAWWTSGRDVFSAELEGVLRLYPVADFPVFIDGNAGYQLSDEPIPPGGTVWNFSFGFGLGADVPVADHTSLMLATTYHHISNALGRDNDRNPSQNEVRLWLGLAWNF